VGLPIVENGSSSCGACEKSCGSSPLVEEHGDHGSCVACATGYCYLAIGTNAGFAMLAIAVGNLTNSRALMASSLFFISSVLSAVVSVIGFRSLKKPADAVHPYDYGKGEYVAILTGSVALVIGMTITFFFSISDILKGASRPPHTIGVVVATVALISSYLLANRGRSVAPELNSPSFTISVEHPRAGMLVAGAVIVGVLGPRFGFPILDQLVAVLEVLFLAAFAGRAFGRGAKGLMDTALDPEIESELRRACGEASGVRNVLRLRTRQSGSIPWADVIVSLREDSTVSDAHRVVARINDIVREILGDRSRAHVGFVAEPPAVRIEEGAALNG
jgi:cation diffusion facilitator family transporter